MKIDLSKKDMENLILALVDAIEYCNESLDYYKTHQFEDEYENLITEMEDSQQNYTKTLETLEKTLDIESEKAKKKLEEYYEKKGGGNLAKAN